MHQSLRRPIMTPSNCHTCSELICYVTGSHVLINKPPPPPGPSGAQEGYADDVLPWSVYRAALQLHHFIAETSLWVQKHLCGLQDEPGGFSQPGTGTSASTSISTSRLGLGEFWLQSNFQRHVRPSLWHISWKSEHGAATVILCFCCILEFKISPFKPNCGSKKPEIT